MKLSDLVGVRALGLRIVVGGGDVGGLPVTEAFITDLPDPSQFLQPGMVVVSNGLWTRAPGGTERFVEALVAARATALVLGTVELGEVPHLLVEVCRRAGLVLATLPDGASFTPVVQAIAGSVGAPVVGASPDAGLVTRVQRLVADGAVAEAFALVNDAFDVDCCVVDGVGAVVAAAGEVDPALVVAAWSGATLPAGVAAWGLGTRAWLLARHPDGELGEEVRRVLDPLAAVLRPGQRFAARERTERWNRVAELLGAAADESAPPGEVAALARLAELDPAEPLRVVVARVDVARTGEARFPVDALAELLGRVCAGPGTRVAVSCADLTATANRTATAIVSGTFDLAARLGDRLPEPVDLLGSRTLVVATSDPVAGVGRLGTAQAVALERSGQIEATARSATAKPFVLVDSSTNADHRSLLRMVPHATREAYADTVLGPVQEYDQRHGGDLVRTLEVFLEHGGSWSEAARVLHVHPNTLRYRLARVEDLTHRDLSTTRGRVDVFLALHCRAR